MGQDKDILVLSGGMDKDTDERLIAEGDYIDALSMRIAESASSNQGAGENVRGFVNYPNSDIPTTGVNKSIGTLEDNKDFSLFYFLYNSAGYHGIYRFFRNHGPGGSGAIEKLLKINDPLAYTLVDNPLNFDRDHLITGIDFVGDKLYWSDDHARPRKINVVKANNTDKRKIFRLYFNTLGFSIASLVTFNMIDATGVTTSFSFSTATTSLQGLIDAFMVAYNSDLPSVALYRATPFQGYVEIQMTSAGDYYASSTIFSSAITYENRVVPYNFYPDHIPGIPSSYAVFPADFIDAIKYPPMCQPTARYQSDPDRNVNLVREKVFQFRLQYIYDDAEKSVWGAISNVAVPNFSCDTSLGGMSDNYIEVDFTDARLNDVSLMSIIKRVNIAVREHNTGDWKLVDSLEPYLWGIGTNIYKFYNDKVYQSIDQGEAILPYHALPDLAKSQELIDDRIMYGGITEGHDKVSVDAQVNVAYTPNVKQATYTIRGIVFIRGLYQPNGSNSDPYPSLYQPIYAHGNSDVIFGGADGLATDIWRDENTVENLALQVLPLEGFVMYLAGTPFYGVSKQYLIHVAGSTGGQYGNGNFFTANSFADRLAINVSMRTNYPFSINPWGLGPHAQPHPHNRPGYHDGAVSGNPYICITPTEPPTGVFSTFEITGVPEGKYVLRVADHRTTADQLSGDLETWQGRSTSVIECGGAFDTEMVIEVNATTSVGGAVYVGRTCIADTSSLKVAQGYLGDHDLASTITATSILADTRIERARVDFVAATINTAQSWYFSNPWSTAYSPWLDRWKNKYVFTDHNGYYFYASDGLLANHLDISAMTSGQSTVPNVLTSATIDGNGNPYSSINTVLTKVFFTRNLLATISDTGRTFVTGNVLTTSGAGVSGANVVNTHNRAHETDFQGQFKIPVYVDSFLLIADATPRRFARIIFSTQQKVCVLSFITDEYNYNGLVHPGIRIDVVPYYNTTAATYYYAIGDFLASIISSAIGISGWKHGMDSQFGLVYYDEADRRTAVCTSEELNKHIAFYTEIDPATGLIAQQGLPLLSWKIYHEPPQWATKWQWVRTKNTQLNYYLQWAIDDVYYTDDNGTVTTYLQATRIHIRTDNFAYYNQTHPNSYLNYNYEKGDHIRFVKDASANFYNTYYDFEILDVNTITAVITITNDVTMPRLGRGAIYEIYTPRLKSNVNLFYEFSQCYQVKSAIFNGLIKKYHAGDSQDQSFGPLPTLTVTPATGNFLLGNVYYRQRNIPVGVYDHNTNSTAIGTVIAQIDDASISDFFDSTDESIGRPNTDLETIGRLERDTAMRLSDRYIQDTNVNGLNAFQPLNQKQLSNNFGKINKLVVINDGVLMAICNNSKIITMYINRNILKTAGSGGNLLVALTDEVIAQSNILQRTFGTQNPESVMMNDEQDVFMWDMNIGVVPRYTGNQLEAISDFKMSKYFAGASDGQVIFPPGKFKAVAVYDRRFNEYILSFNPLPAPLPQHATSILCLADLQPIGERNDTYHIQVHLQPMGILLCDFTVTHLATTWSLSTLIVRYITRGASGFTASILPSGCLLITAPEAGTLYNNNSLVVTFVHQDISYSYPMGGGTN